ncbi:MAG TPA: hypothetical protein VEC37_06245 [Bacillota bacterium]|nr:hypothetical protein [Bacillota bacterium]
MSVPNNETIEALKNCLIGLAQDQTLCDGREEWDLDIGDRCGGNYEGAYNRGNNDGYTDLARELLRDFFDIKLSYEDDE